MSKDYEMVNHPSHYNNYDIEVIDMIERIWGIDAVIQWCEITAFKYRMRVGTKPGNSVEQDLNKEQWYLNKAKEYRVNKSYNQKQKAVEENKEEKVDIRLVRDIPNDEYIYKIDAENVYNGEIKPEYIRMYDDRTCSVSCISTADVRGDITTNVDVSIFYTSDTKEIDNTTKKRFNKIKDINNAEN